MENLLCHPGRIFTLDGLTTKPKPRRKAMPRELNEWLRIEKKTICRTAACRSAGNQSRCISNVAGCMDVQTSHNTVTSSI